MIKGIVAGFPSNWASGFPYALAPSFSTLSQFQSPPQAIEKEGQELDQEDEHVDEGLAEGETFEEYRPKKLNIGKKHPDPCVETASLGSVDPPDIFYQLKLPQEIINNALLSDLQLEAIVYACQAHDRVSPEGVRGGYLIGDGAGVGKGRTIAGLIFENWLQGRRKAIWISVSTDLKVDAERDLHDIHAEEIPVFPLMKLPYGQKLNSYKGKSMFEGVLYSTYSTLISKGNGTGKFFSRIEQIINWFGEEYDGIIVFDEAHKAKNMAIGSSGKSSKTALCVADLQRRLPLARIVYASATGASEVKQMAYMDRLGLWGPYPGSLYSDFKAFATAIEKRGVPGLEATAMELKRRGLYCARQLSFNACSFKIDTINLPETFINMYDESVQLWRLARECFSKAADVYPSSVDSVREKKMMWSFFYGAQQRFFRYLCSSSKVDHVVNLAKTALKDNKSVIIGLQMTGEHVVKNNDVFEDDEYFEQFRSPARATFEALMLRFFPLPSSVKLNMVKKSNGDCKSNENNDLRPLSVSNSSESMSLNESSALSKIDKEIIVLSSESESESVEEILPDCSFFEFSKTSRRNSTRTGSSVKRKREDSDYDSDDFLSQFTFKSKERDPWLAILQGRSESRKSSSNNPYDEFSFNYKDNCGFEAQRSKYILETCKSIWKEVWSSFQRIACKLPGNVLDALIHRLGGPESVSEMTGRKCHLIKKGSMYTYQKRAQSSGTSMEALNLHERERFVSGKTLVAIISEAASIGISLQADKRFKNQRRRVHITLELPWSADKAIQQFGRSHRSNQVSGPEYILLSSGLAGETRFAGAVAKRLQNLGALTHGDRRAASADSSLAEFNVDTKYGAEALRHLLSVSLGHEEIIESPIVSEFEGDFPQMLYKALSSTGIIENRKEVEYSHSKQKTVTMVKFLNRLLCMYVKDQNLVFAYFSMVMNDLISSAIRTGKFDNGILELSTDPKKVREDNVSVYKFVSEGMSNELCIHKMSVERGISWSDALQKYLEWPHKSIPGADRSGFYKSKSMKKGRNRIILALQDYSVVKSTFTNRFSVFKPNIGASPSLSSSDLISGYDLIPPEKISVVAKKLWDEFFHGMDGVCVHSFWSNMPCKNKRTCDVGMRRRAHYVATGSILYLFPLLETMFKAGEKVQLLRISYVKNDEEKKIVGIFIPKKHLDAVKKKLKARQRETTENDSL